MIAATGLELRAGAQLLLDGATFQISPGDKVGLVGRNGAGKTTLARVLAGDGLPAAGTVRRNGTIGYLPQDSRAGDLAALAMDRILSARGLDEVRAGMRTAEEAMSDPNPERRDAAVRRYSTLEERLVVLGGYAAEAEAAAIASSLGLPDRVVAQPLHTLSGGQRRRVELARILFSDAQTTAARRAHQPPGRRLHRLAARPPPHVPRLGGDHQPRPRRCWRRWSAGSSISTPTGRNSTSTTSAGGRTWSSVRPTRGGASGRRPAPSARRPPCRRRRTRCGRRRPRPGRPRAWSAGRSGCWPG